MRLRRILPVQKRAAAYASFRRIALTRSVELEHAKYGIASADSCGRLARELAKDRWWVVTGQKAGSDGAAANRTKAVHAAMTPHTSSPLTVEAAIGSGNAWWRDGISENVPSHSIIDA
jgi:hypothetical protein